MNNPASIILAYLLSLAAVVAALGYYLAGISTCPVILKDAHYETQPHPAAVEAQSTTTFYYEK